MRKLVFYLLISGLLSVSGCQTVKNTAAGIGAIGKGIVDDVYNAYKSLDRADKWFQENYW